MFNGFGSHPELTDCTFDRNTGDHSSGVGMFNCHSSPILHGCEFTQNRSGGTGGGSGVGMMNIHSHAKIVKCVFAGNSSAFQGEGGAVANRYGEPRFEDCTFEGNSIDSYGFGGGMFNHHSRPTLDRCTFTSNSAYNGIGGGMCNRNSGTLMRDCTFEVNWAEVGGAVSNSTKIDGRILTPDDDPTLIGCTMTGNWCDLGSGGVETSTPNPSLDFGPCVPRMTACRLWCNSPVSMDDPFEDGGDNCIRDDCIECPETGAGNGAPQ